MLPTRLAALACALLLAGGALLAGCSSSSGTSSSGDDDEASGQPPPGRRTEAAAAPEDLRQQRSDGPPPGFGDVTPIGAVTNIPAAWALDIGTPETVHVAGERVVLGEGYGLSLINAATGQLMTGQLPVQSELDAEASVGGVPASELSSGGFVYAPLPSVGTLLLGDYGEERDYVLALALDTARFAWASSGLPWSGKGIEEAREALRAGFRARRRRALDMQQLDDPTPRYVYTSVLDRLVHPLPDSQAVLMLLRGGLRQVDPASGETQWRARDVGGEAIAGVTRIRRGDLLVATYATSLTDEDAKALARIDAATGQVRWQATYAGPGDDLLSLRVEGNQAVMRFRNGVVETFDMSTGRRVLLTGQAKKGRGASGPAFIAPNGTAFAPHPSEARLGAYDLASGIAQWTSNQLRGGDGLTDIFAFGPRVIARITDGSPSSKGGIYAWTPYDGVQQWRALPDANLRSTIVAGGLIFALANDRLYALSPENGGVQRELDLRDSPIGEGRHLIGTQGATLVVVGTRGVAFLVREGFAPREVVATAERVVAVRRAGDRLALGVGSGDALTGVHVVDLVAERRIGSVAFQDDPQTPRGVFQPYGFHLTPDGQTLYVLDGERLARHDLVTSPGG